MKLLLVFLAFLICVIAVIIAAIWEFIKYKNTDWEFLDMSWTLFWSLIIIFFGGIFLWITKPTKKPFDDFLN